MSIVTITINNKQFQIACNDGQEELLQSAANKLSENLERIKTISPKASTELLLILCALGLQDENSNLRSKLDNTGFNDNEKLSETLSTIAGYLEELATKINH
jgi:cell division protein ZapA (FtsZ GTPase activity inhibitor)